MYFIITVDTEGDNLWRIHRYSDRTIITNRNGNYLERFQLLCEKYAFIPTYFVNYEMLSSDAFVELGRYAAKMKLCEIGMHMHAWNSPPYYSLQRASGKKYGKPYAGEYPIEILNRKMEFLHEKLEITFGTEITSHRGGRWYLDENILKFLIEHHYMADATVTPGITWKNAYGNSRSGCNYKDVKMRSYEIDRNNILKSGKSGIMEIPPTIEKLLLWDFRQLKRRRRNDVGGRYWIRPDGNNLREMILILFKMIYEKKDYIEFMIHSSELMPGGSPVFKTVDSIEKLYYDMEIFFSIAAKYCKGIGISDYARKIYCKAK